MKGLLIKDFYNIKKQIIWYIGMIIIFFSISVAVKNIAFMVSIGILVTISIPLTAIAYEEKESWQKFIVASGMSKKIIVFEKYLLGLIFFAVSSAGYVAVFFILGENASSLTEVLIPVFLQLMILSAILPVVFKFGVEKARTFTIIIVVIIMLVLVGFLNYALNIGKDVEIIICVVLSIISAVFTALSYILSVKIYNKKEF